MGAAELFKGGKHAVQPKAGADAGKLLSGEEFGKVVITAAGTDAADPRQVTKDRLVNGACVIIQSAGDGNIQHHTPGGPAAGSDAGEQFPQVLKSLLTGGAAGEHAIKGEQNLVGIAAELCHVEDAGGGFGGYTNLFLHFRLYGITADFIELIKAAEDAHGLVLESAGFQEPVEHFAVVDADCEAFDADAFQQIVDDEECFDVGGVAERADGVEVALQKFAEATAGRAFTTPDGADVIAAEGCAELL